LNLDLNDLTMKKIVILFLAVAIFSCNNPGQLRRAQIIGKWTNLSLLVTMKKLDNQDSILEANEHTWEEVLKIKPIISTFDPDGSFVSEYSNLQGEIIREVKGKWDIRNDSLIILTEGVETAYHFTINGNRVKFRSQLDWDGDGESDDFYDAIQVRIEE